MRKKIVSALLCGVMALGCLTACNSENAQKVKELVKNTDVSGLESVEKEIVSSVTGAGVVPTKDRSGNDIKVPAEVKSIVSLAPSTTRVLIDLGLAKDVSAARGHAGESLSIVDGKAVGVGTPRYAAPEQLTGDEISPATDVYALGMLANDCFVEAAPQVEAHNSASHRRHSRATLCDSG